MTSRETRRYKQRGISISFGDIMLPLVGIVAIGLLIVAGKLFFLSGIRPERSPAPLVRERPRVELGPIQEDSLSGDQSFAPVLPPEGAKLASGASSSVSEASLDAAVTEAKLPTPRRASLAMDVLAIPYGVVSESPAAAQEGSGKAVAAPKPQARRVDVVVTPAKKPAPPPAQTPRTSKVSPAPQAARKPVSSPVPVKPKAPAAAPPKPAPPKKSALWQVQVGAFSTRDSASEVSRKLSQSGYKASIVSGTRFHRVLVQGGTTRQDAAAVVSRLAKEGFAGAFAIPPSSP